MRNLIPHTGRPYQCMDFTLSGTTIPRLLLDSSDHRDDIKCNRPGKLPSMQQFKRLCRTVFDGTGTSRTLSTIMSDTLRGFGRTHEGPSEQKPSNDISRLTDSS